MAIVDNLIAFRVLYMLVTPFEKTDAFKLGIIDKDGKALKKVKDFTTSEEKDAYTALHRLVFNLKKLLSKVPGGKSQLASIVAAYWLIKENMDVRTSIKEEELLSIIDLIESKHIHMVEEEIDVMKFLKSINEEGMIANVVGDGKAVSVDQPTIKPRKKKYLKMFKRSTQVE